MAATINIPWNEFEAVLLVEACSKVISGEASKSDVIPDLSCRLRERMINQGLEVNDTYRNENGIALQLSAMQYIMTNGENGLPGGSALFAKMATLWLEDRESFDSKLLIANKIYPRTCRGVSAYNLPTENECRILEDVSTENAYGTQTLEHGNSLISRKIIEVLRTSFSKGYRLNSTIEERRFKQYYSCQHAEEFPESIKLQTVILELGIQHENKVYLPESMLTADVRYKIQSYISSHFVSSEYIYYDAILDKFSEELVDSQIFDKDTLRSYLQHYDVYGWSYGTFYIAKSTSVSVNQDQDIIEFVRLQGGITSEIEIEEAFHYMPREYVIRCVERNNKTLISCGRGGYRFHIDNYVINDKQKEGIDEIIRLSIQSDGYLTTSELVKRAKIKYPYILSDNADYGIIGFRNVVASMFSGKYSFYNNLISPVNSRIDTNKVFEDFCKNKHMFTIEEVDQLADDLGTQINFDIIARYCVRVSENEFVAKDCVIFDVEATDSAIENYCQSEYVPLNAINTFVAFPYCSYKWTNFLLESFVAQYSGQFELMHHRYNKDKTAGAIVKRSSKFSNYDEILIDAVANSKVDINEKDVLDYLQDKGFIARRRADFLSKISLIEKAAVVRNRNKN